MLKFLKEGDGIRYTIDVTGPGVTPRQMGAFIRFDGKPYPETGNPTADHNVFTRLDDRTLQIVDLKDGKETLRFRVSYSADGKTRTSVRRALNPMGATVVNRDLGWVDRYATPRSGWPGPWRCCSGSRSRPALTTRRRCTSPTTR